MFFNDALRAAESLPEGTEESPPETLASTAGGEAVAAVVPADETVDKHVTTSVRLFPFPVRSYPCLCFYGYGLLWVLLSSSLFFLHSLPSTTGKFISKPTTEIYSKQYRFIDFRSYFQIVSSDERRQENSLYFA